jgi:hypothetical protein
MLEEMKACPVCSKQYTGVWSICDVCMRRKKQLIQEIENLKEILKKYEK